MDAAMDCEAPGAFYRAEEGEEFFNASVSEKREEGTTPVSEGERSTRGGSWFPHGGLTGGCNIVAICVGYCC
jgi:hypothetical protein